MENTYYGGRVRDCYEFWTTITRNRNVLRIVGGVSIPFTEKDVINDSPPLQLPLSKVEKEHARTKIAKLLQTKCIVKLERPIKGGWRSSIFLRLKRDQASYRLIVNLRPLNCKIAYKHFQMPSIYTVLQMVRVGDKFCSIDLEEAFGSLYVRDQDQCKLQFSFEGNHFMYRVVPNGISIGPLVFQTLTKTLTRYFSKEGIQIVIYIDDSLLINRCTRALIQDRDRCLSVFEKCGFTVNTKKSQLTPTTRIEFLGFVIDSIAFTVFLTELKRSKTRMVITNALKAKNISVRQLARVIGLVISIFPASETGKLHYRDMEREKVYQLRTLGGWNKKFVLGHRSRAQMMWWSRFLTTCPTRSLKQSSPTIEITTDASNFAWAGLLAGKPVNGSFSEKQMQLSINTKELLAIYYTVCTLHQELSHHHILCHCDNQTAISCMNRRGNQCLLKDKIVGKLYSKLHEISSTITVTHVAGIHNSADYYSRHGYRKDHLEYTIPSYVKDYMLQHLPFTLDIDLFASHLNNQFPLFCSYKPDPKALFINAFSISWRNWKPYIYCPFSLINRCLQKIENDKVADAVMLIPIWPASSFFGVLLRHLKSPPLPLPIRTGRELFLPWDKSQTMQIKGLRLALVHLSATSFAPRVCPALWHTTLLQTLGEKPPSLD